jgi:hypothetical protein
LEFDYILNLARNHEAIFVQEIIEEGPLSRTRIDENMIPDTVSVAQLILEKQTRDERGQSAEQAIVSNNYHNIFILDKHQRIHHKNI